MLAANESVSCLGIYAMKKMAALFFESAKYLGILLGLLVFGYFGHRTHWNFGYVKSDSQPATNLSLSREDSDHPRASGDWEFSFRTEKSLLRSGVKTTMLQQRTIRESVKTIGVINYDERMTAGLSARVTGTVWSVVKQAGDPIRRGDVLVIIDAAEVGRAKANFLSDLVDVESKSDILSALESVSSAISDRQIRAARVAVREAKIRLKNSEQNLVNLGLKVRNETFESLNDNERAAKLNFLGLPESIVKKLDPSQTTSNLLALTAPFDGILIRQDVAQGEMVEAGKPVVEITDLHRMWLKLDVPIEDAAKLSLGQRVQFTADGVDREFDGPITWISTAMNEKTRTLSVRAEVDNPVLSTDASTGHEVRLLRANTFGTGTIALRESSSAFVVPVSAIQHADREALIFVRTGELSFTRRNVMLGIREGEFVQIESDELRPEMEVVTQGCHVLKSEWILNHVASTAAVMVFQHPV